MANRIKVIHLLLVVFLAALPLFAEESEADNPFKLGFSIGIGTATFTEEGDLTQTTYQKLSLSPDIAYGKLGIGLDITFHYTFTGPPPSGDEFYVRQEDWVPTGDDSILDVYLPKFRYIRWGHKGDPLYIKLGSIDDATLGNGFIMGNYSNTLFLPEKRIFGLTFDLDGELFNFPVVGMETFTANLAQFDVMGFRPFVRPLINTDIPILSNLQLGATLAVDTKPDLYADVANPETIAVYGGDFILPLISKPLLTLATFGDVASLHGESLGSMVGFGGRLIKFLTYGAQVRFLGENFVPTYFDASYDLFRAEKFAIAKGAAGVPPFTGWLASLGTTFFDDTLVFRASLDGPFSKPDPDNTDNYLNYPHLYATFLIAEGLVPHLSFDASYDKRLIRNFEDLVDPEDAVIRARANYHVGGAVISFIYNIRYVPDPLPGEDEWEVTSGLEAGIQIF